MTPKSGRRYKFMNESNMERPSRSLQKQLKRKFDDTLDLFPTISELDEK